MADKVLMMRFFAVVPIAAAIMMRSGFPNGWSATGKRHVFLFVTGTGALISPFALPLCGPTFR